MILQIGFKITEENELGTLTNFWDPSESFIIDTQLKTKTTQIRFKAIIMIIN
jgi:hypothetical protein